VPKEKPPPRPRTIADDLVDAILTGTRPWTRQRKSEERHPGNIRYRLSRMTKESRTKQVGAAANWMEWAYMRASGGGRLPASARQIYYQIRPKVMAETEDKELQYGYFSQTVLPNYIEKHGVAWDVVYDARGHFEEPHTNRRIGCGTIEVGNYLSVVKDPEIEAADFAGASVSVIGPVGGFNKIMYYEKEGFNPLWKAVNLANRHDVLIISNKGQSVTAARKLIDVLCGRDGLPLLVLHDFDLAGFAISGVLQRDTRRYRFKHEIRAIDLGLRLEDIEGLEREPAAASKVPEEKRRAQLARNGATEEEIEILLHERVELNAMTSEALVAKVEAGLTACGVPQKVIPTAKTLAEAHRAFHRSLELRKKFGKMVEEFDEAEGKHEVEVPSDLREQVAAVLAKHEGLRWDEAVRIVIDPDQLDHVRDEKEKAKKKSGDFTDAEDAADEDEG
jgi:hypothetical protein